MLTKSIQFLLLIIAIDRFALYWVCNFCFILHSPYSIAKVLRFTPRRRSAAPTAGLLVLMKYHSIRTNGHNQFSSMSGAHALLSKLRYPYGQVAKLVAVRRTGL